MRKNKNDLRVKQNRDVIVSNVIGNVLGRLINAESGNTILLGGGSLIQPYNTAADIYVLEFFGAKKLEDVKIDRVNTLLNVRGVNDFDLSTLESMYKNICNGCVVDVPNVPKTEKDVFGKYTELAEEIYLESHTSTFCVYKDASKFKIERVASGPKVVVVTNEKNPTIVGIDTRLKNTTEALRDTLKNEENKYTDTAFNTIFNTITTHRTKIDDIEVLKKIVRSMLDLKDVHPDLFIEDGESLFID